jgi:hypothetical protein
MADRSGASLPRVGVGQRRARFAVRHHLAPAARAARIVDVARDLVALHSTDPASVFLSAWARLRDPDVAAMEAAIYDERTLVRMLGMRRTMFVVPGDAVAVVHGACTRAIVPRERRLLVQVIEEGGIAAAGSGEAWLREAEEATLRALAARGEAFGVELSAEVPQLREQLRYGEGKRWGRVGTLVTRVLFLLAAEGRISRGRPRGSWTSSQYRWAPVEPGPAGDGVELPAPAARAELARRWLWTFGPAPAGDLKWWAGWTGAETKAALAAAGAVEVELDGSTGFALPGDLEPEAAPEPWAALLPALDPTVMGWSDRGWFLSAHGPALFDRSGNVGPTVWWEGRIVGGWAQRRSGEVVFRLLEDVGAEACRAVAAEAERLTAWLGPIRVTPRFRTPLERELVA